MISRLSVPFALFALLAGCGQSATAPVLEPGPSGITNLPMSVGGARKSPPVQFFGTNLPWPEDITVGPDGNIWFTEFYANEIARITPSGTITQFSLGNGGEGEGITVGPDANLWVAEPGSDMIGRITTTGTVTNFQVVGSNPSPRNIAVGPDGNLWFTEFYDGYLDRITTAGVITRFQISPSSQPWDVIAGPDGNMWFTDSDNDALGRFSPASQKFLSPIALAHGTNPWALTIGPDHDIWFTGRSSGTIGTVANVKACRQMAIASDWACSSELMPGSAPLVSTKVTIGSPNRDASRARRVALR